MTNQPSYQWDEHESGKSNCTFPCLFPSQQRLSLFLCPDQGQIPETEENPSYLTPCEYVIHGRGSMACYREVSISYAIVTQQKCLSKVECPLQVSVCINLFVLDVIISNEQLKKLFQERWTLCFSGWSYFKFWRLLCPFLTGLQLQHVRIWCRGMEQYSPSRTLLHTPSRRAAPLYSLDNPSQVRTIWRKYDSSLTAVFRRKFLLINSWHSTCMISSKICVTEFKVLTKLSCKSSIFRIPRSFMSWKSLNQEIKVYCP